MSSTTIPTTEEDENLEAFFRDIEKLEISSEKQSSEHAAAHDDTVWSATVVPPKASNNNEKKKKKDANKEVILQKAEQHQQSWQEFAIEKAAEEATADRPKISFALNTKKKKKTKFSQKETKTSSSTTTQEQAADASTTAPNNTTPRWTAVLDTCALLQSLEDVCALLQHAQQPAALEPLTLVVPYKLWSELDYQSKLEEEDKQRQARCAVRVLNRAISKQQKELTTSTRNAVSSSLAYHFHNKPFQHVVIRSQSRAEMNRIATDMNFMDDANNDDHILGCALAEQQRDFSEYEAGGVVLLTLDKVLSGKARADGVTVYTPSSFLDYYRRRDASLRARMMQ